MGDILRWLALLPGSILCALIAPFLLHWILWGALTQGGSIEPYYEAPERLLTPFAMALAFVWAGSKIAPRFRLESAAVLFGLWLLLSGAAFALGFDRARILGAELYLQAGGLAWFGGVIGAFFGLGVVRWDEHSHVGKRLAN